MPDNAAIPDGEAVPETAKEKFERERLSRRQALKKFGMTSAMATLGLFSVDDLARMVGKAMQQRAGDNKVAEQVAKEFQQAGVAFASGPSPALSALPYGNCNSFQGGNANACNACNNDRLSRCSATCGQAACAGAYNCGTGACSNATPTYAQLQYCWQYVCGSCLANCN